MSGHCALTSLSLWLGSPCRPTTLTGFIHCVPTTLYLETLPKNSPGNTPTHIYTHAQTCVCVCMCVCSPGRIFQASLWRTLSPCLVRLFYSVASSPCGSPLAATLDTGRPVHPICQGWAQFQGRKPHRWPCRPGWTGMTGLRFYVLGPFFLVHFLSLWVPFPSVFLKRR